MGSQSLCGDIMRKVLDYDAGGHGLHFSGGQKILQAKT